MTMILCIGLVGRLYSEASREWWARQGAWTIILSLAWLGLCVMSLYGPPLADYLLASAMGWGSKIMASTWIGATLSLPAARSRRPERQERSQAGVRLHCRPGADRVCGRPDGAGVGRVVPGRIGAHPGPRLHVTIPDGIMSGYYANTALIPPSITAAVLVALLIGGFLLARRVDINKFSLYMMYRNRLTRAFLGAHNKDRSPHPFTGFDEHDDILLSKLITNQA
ncbi:hypothetical protein LP419_11805 [Massilia sp. H-1]|nr:hypothetical protein LP419_11805 [Massilia sp. H-1]